MSGFRVGESFCHFFSSSPVYRWLTSRWKYYVQFCRSAIFVSGMAITHKFVNYVVVSVLITFIKEYSDQKLVGSTVLANMGDAISGLARIFMTAISTSFACHQKVIFCSTSLYILGLILLSLIAYEVISARISYMIVALVLIQVGKAGSKPILDNFFRQQLCFHETKGEEDHGRVGARFKAWTLAAWLLALIPIILIADSGWQKTLVVSSSMLAFSCACFLCGSFSYHRVDPTISPPTVVFRVITAAILKIKVQYPASFNKFFHNNSLKEEKIFSRPKGNDRIYLLPDVRFCGWVDKAAIKESFMEEQGRKRRTVREVQETKHVLRMVPIWVVFFGFGVARATWDTLFVEQADNYGSDTTTTTLLVISTVSEVSISHIYDWICGWTPDARKRYCFLKLRIWLGMLMCTACFTVAWKIQEAVPKSTWVLVPQFCLSGFAEGLGMDGLADFYDYQVPPSMRGYGGEFNGLVTASGNLIAIVFLFTSRRSWFGDDLESSYLDKYYFFITLLTITSSLVVSYLLLASYAYSSDMTDDPTGHLKSEPVIAKDESENEARLHAQAVEMVGVDHKNDAP